MTGKVKQNVWIERGIYASMHVFKFLFTFLMLVLRWTFAIGPLSNVDVGPASKNDVGPMLGWRTF